MASLMGSQFGSQPQTARLQPAAWEGSGTLPDRRAFHERLAQALQVCATGGGQARSLAVLLLRLDLVADVGSVPAMADEDGRQMQRAALRLTGMPELLAGVWQLNVRVYACLAREPAARGREPLAALARGLLNKVAEPAPQGIPLARLRPSIGIAVYPSDGSTGAALLRRAEAATQRASRQSLGLAFFERQSDL